MKKLDVPQSGSQASTTASRNRFGQYNRTRAIPTNPDTLRQSLVRTRLAQASTAWQELTQAVRNAWNAYAAITSRVDSLGQTIFLTGHQQFVALYTASANLALALPPAVPTSAPPPAALVTTFDVSVTASVWTMILNGVTAIPADALLIISASLMRSPGVSYESDFRFITFASALVMTNAAFGTPWIAKFGNPAVGRKIFVRTQFFTAAGGHGPITQYSTVAVAV